MNKDKSLFTIPIDEISIEDIRNFCSLNIQENAVVEYKENFADSVKDKVIKTIAAMANTDGGLILLGVREGKNCKEPAIIGITGTNLKQTIFNKCHSDIQPPYCPEVQEIPIDNEKVILFIRINRDYVPSLPVFHREHGFQVRRDSQTRPATLNEIKWLSNENEQRENRRLKRGINMFDTVGFRWYNISICLPLRRYTGLETQIWTGDKIIQIKEVIENHSVNDTKIWIKRFCPRTNENCQIQYRPGDKCITFSSFENNSIPQPDGAQFKMHFYPQDCVIEVIMGFLSDSINPTKKEIMKEVGITVYSVLDLLTVLEVEKYFQDYLPEGGEYILDVRANGGLPESKKVNSIEPERLTKEYIHLFLASRGHMVYEEDLEKLDIKALFD